MLVQDCLEQKSWKRKRRTDLPDARHEVRVLHLGEVVREVSVEVQLEEEVGETG